MNIINRTFYKFANITHGLLYSISYSEGVSFPAALALRLDFPQLKEVASIFKNGGQITVVIRNQLATVLKSNKLPRINFDKNGEAENRTE
ncbi:MAG: hypothetical protein ABIN97_04135 [Ginsengibacter sp.]